MSYSNTLSNMIDQSGLTLREIADLATNNGIKIDPSYISKLQKGRQSPPSEKVSKILAKILNNNPDELVLEGYIEKAPSLIKDYINITTSNFKNIFKFLIQQNTPEEFHDLYLSKIEEMSLLEFITEINSGAINPLEIQEGGLILGNDEEEQLQNRMIVNLSHDMKDDSMNPLIPKGSRVNYKEESNYINGDILLVKLNNNNVIIRKSVFADSKIILIPENNKYETLVLAEDECKIVGKIHTITINV